MAETQYYKNVSCMRREQRFWNPVKNCWKNCDILSCVVCV